MVSPGGFSIKYADKSASKGDYISDNFQINGATVSALQMGLAYNTTVGMGIMGIGYQAGESVTTKNRYPNLVDQLAAQKLINLKAYSLWLDDLETTTGKVLFGGIDTAKFVGQLKVLPVQNDPRSASIRSFTVFMTSLSVTDNSGSTSTLTNSTFQLPVILDSGTTISYVPSAVLKSIISQLGAVDDRGGSGVIFVDCNWRTTRPNEFISFGFGGSGGPVINIPISEFIRTLRKSNIAGSPFTNTCGLGIGSTTSLFLLGDTFLRSAYVVYDLDHNQIGMAQTNFEATDSNVQEIPSSATGIPLLTGVTPGVTQVPQSHFSGGKTTSSTKLKTSANTGSETGAVNSVPAAATPTAGTGTSSSSKSAAVGTVPAFEASALVVFAISCIFSLAGGSWFIGAW